MSLDDAGQEEGGNLEASTLQQYLRGIETFPAEKDAVASTAGSTVLPRTWSDKSGMQIPNASTVPRRLCKRSKAASTSMNKAPSSPRSNRDLTH